MSKILLVDDEPKVLRSLTAALEEDHDIYTSQSALEAQAAIEAGAKFDAIISDQIMPEMKGHELLNWCQLKSPEIKRIMLTGIPITDELKQEIDDIESVRIFRKPWNIDEINKFLKSEQGKSDTSLTNSRLDVAVAGHKALVFEPSERYQALCSDLAPTYFNTIIHYNTGQELLQGAIENDDVSQIIFSLRDGSEEELSVLAQLRTCCPQTKILITAEPRTILALDHTKTKVAGFEALIKPFSSKRLANIVVGAH